LILLTVVLMGYKNKQQRLRIQVARSGLQSQLNGVEKNNDGSSLHRYLIESFREGIKNIDRLPGGKLVRPMPVLATMLGQRTKEGEGKRWRLGFQWLEQDFDVTGFYLLDKTGNVTEYPAALDPWNSFEMKFLASTAWRENWVPVIADVSDKSTWQKERERAWPVNSPVVLPPLDFSKGDVQLGLMTKAGRVPSTVVIGFGFIPVKEMGDGTSQPSSGPEKDSTK